MKFNTEDTKNTNITPIYRDNKKLVFTKVIKIPSWMAWVQKPSGLI